MVKIGPAEHSDHFSEGPKSLLKRLTTCLLVFLICGLVLAAVGTLIGDAGYLGYLATRATVFDTWGALSILSAMLSATAIAGAGFALWRRKLVLALGFAALAAPTPFVIEASRCDTAGACRLMGWAALPPGAFAWGVRLRPVTDINEAKVIASAALSRAGSGYSPFKAKQLGDHWIVSAIDEEGWPGPHAVSIQTRSGKTSLVACPADRIQCGMERPTVSDGRRPFRNDSLALTAVFPGSRPVCTGRGDDGAPRGFFAMVRAPDTPCEILDASREMGIEVARSRKNGCLSMEAPSMPWRPLSPATARLFRNPAPTLGGRPALVCELRDGGDQIQISAYATAPNGSAADRSPGALYEAYIVTTPDHLAEDIHSFEVFLEGLHIGPPVGERTD